MIYQMEFNATFWENDTAGNSNSSIIFFSVDTSKEIMWKFTRRAYTERRLRVIEASAIMHELGHTLGIYPWTFQGCDNFSFLPLLSKNYFDYKKTWGNYCSRRQRHSNFSAS